MGDEEEDNPSVPKDSSKGSIPRARQPRTSKTQTNDLSSSNQGPSRRTRPGRAQRQRRRDAAESSAPTNGSSNLNPSAPDFVPRGTIPVSVAQNQNETHRNNRNRPRGGRRGKPAKANEGTSTEGTSRDQPSGPPPRSRKYENTKIRVQPKIIIKESEDLMLRMTEALSKNEYDCSICTDSV